MLPDKLKRFIHDLGLNTISNLTVVVLTQLLIFPLLGRYLDAVNFGELLFVYAMCNVAGVVIGNTMCNIVLREGGGEDILSPTGSSASIASYNRVFLLSAVAMVSVVMCAGIYLGYGASTVLLTGVYAGLVAIRSYFSVEYRIKLNYLHILTMNVTLMLGVGVGFLLGDLTSMSDALKVFVFGESLVLMYLLITTSAIRTWARSSVRTPSLVKDYLLLGMSTLFINLSTYADRLILKFAIGAVSIPAVFAASVNGKIITLGANTAANVILSYVSRMNVGSFKRVADIYMIATLVLSLVLLGAVELVTPYVINALYPSYLEEAMAIHLYVNIAYVAKAYEGVMRPIFIRYGNISIMTTMDAAAALIYIVIGFVVAMIYGVLGFVIVFMVLSLMKVMVQVVIIRRAIHMSEAEA